MHPTTKLPAAAVLCFAALAAAGANHPVPYWLYVGTYTGGTSKGIYAFHYDAAKGTIKPAGLAVATGNPSFLVAHPNRKFLFAVNENGSETVMGSVSSFAINPATGKLSPINWVSSKGGAPCHLALDHTAKWLAVANYASGSIAMMAVGDDGKLAEPSVFIQQQGSSVNPKRQAGPHAHMVLFSPDNRYLMCADLGADKIFSYRFDAAHGTLTANQPPSTALKPGSGPRHLVFHPNGRFLYAINELASTVTTFTYDAGRGALQELGTVSTLPEGFQGASTAGEIAIDSAGAHIYASNRGHDSIALLSVDPVSFTLSAMEFPPALGHTPRFFALDPSGAGLIVAGQDSGRFQLFTVHTPTGQIRPQGKAVLIDKPVCLVFVPAR